MSAETPEHRDLLSSLAKLPSSKVGKFAIALGVPKNVIDEFQTNHPKDVYRVKSEALSWWIANEEASWEAVARALEATGVDERNLAICIRSSHGLVRNGKSSRINANDTAGVHVCRGGGTLRIRVTSDPHSNDRSDILLSSPSPIICDLTNL